MRRLITLTLLLLLLMAQTAYAGKVIPSKDFTYMGAFQLPRGSIGLSWFGYGGDALAYNPNGNGGAGSLYIEGSTNQMAVAEVSIPVLKTGDISTLNTASLLRSFADISGGRMSTGYTYPKMSLQYLPQMGNMTSPRLLWAGIDAYQCSNGAMGWTGLDFTGVDASWSLSGASNCDDGGYIYSLIAPQAWADTYTGGKRLLMGGDRVAQSGSWGPALYAVTPPWAVGDHPANGTTLAKIQLLSYTAAHPVDHYAVSSSGAQGATWVSVGGKNAVLISRQRSLREFNAPDYFPTFGGTATVRWPFETYKGNGVGTGAAYSGGNGHDYCPECDQYDMNPSGPTAAPYTPEILFYDPDDLAAVAQGTKQPYEPQPYAYWNLGSYFSSIIPASSSCRTIGGLAYDSANQRLFVAEYNAYGSSNPYPVIHVFQLADSGISSIDPTPPPSPAISNASGSLTWNAVTSVNGGVFYAVLKNYGTNGNDYTTGSRITGNFWKPVAITRSTSWTDPYYSSGVELSNNYQVVALDQLLNISLDYIVPPVKSLVGKLSGTVR